MAVYLHVNRNPDSLLSIYLSDLTPAVPASRGPAKSVLTVAPGNFEGQWLRLFSLSSKLSFLLAGLLPEGAPLNQPPGAFALLRQEGDAEFAQLVQWVERYTGYELQVLPGVRGNMSEAIREEACALCEDSAVLRRFLFGEGSFLEMQTAFDPPALMPSDRGHIHTYADLYQAVDPAAKIIELVWLSKSGVSLRFPKGSEVPLTIEIDGRKTHNPLFTQASLESTVVAAHWESCGEPPTYIVPPGPVSLVYAMLASVGRWSSVADLQVSTAQAPEESSGVRDRIHLQLAVSAQFLRTFKDYL